MCTASETYENAFLSYYFNTNLKTFALWTTHFDVQAASITTGLHRISVRKQFCNADCIAQIQNRVAPPTAVEKWKPAAAQQHSHGGNVEDVA
jgi:hypothetical protein